MKWYVKYVHGSKVWHACAIENRIAYIRSNKRKNPLIKMIREGKHHFLTLTEEDMTKSWIDEKEKSGF